MRKSIHFLIYFLAAVLVCTAFSACTPSQELPTDDPAIEVRDLTWGIGGRLPVASDFVKQLPDGASVRFSEEYRFSELGEHRITLIVTLENGKEEMREVALSLVRDTEPPEILGVGDLVAYLGDGIPYRSGVTVSDNCDGEVTLEVDSSAVCLDQEGEYPVTYKATDLAGNQTEITVTLYLYREDITEEMLYAMLDPYLANEVPSSGSLEQKVRAIYHFVYYHVAYDAHSDKSSWVRAAYEGLRTGKGDCYTYFALSKACFERLGIENMDIQRTIGIVDERHYWNFVNIGTEDAPRWYHFDACRLSGVQHSGCLLTELQINAYTAQRTDDAGNRNYFYAYDSSKYPAAETEIITPTPALEPYY